MPLPSFVAWKFPFDLVGSTGPASIDLYGEAGSDLYGEAGSDLYAACSASTGGSERGLSQAGVDSLGVRRTH